MWIKTYSKTYHELKKEDVWSVWSDVNNWIKWSNDLDYCKMDGDFKVGNHFILKPKGAPAVKIKLIEVDECRSFTDCTTFLGAKMYDTHTMEETAEGLRLTSTLKVTGLLTFVWVKLVAQNVAKSVPQEMDALVKLARSGSVSV